MQEVKTRATQGGFGLIETMFATLALSGGLLTLAAVFTQGLFLMSVAQTDMIAKQKATEALESIFSGRDNGVLTWNSLRNVADGGVFLNGPQTMYTDCATVAPNPPNDGVVNTADDSLCPQDSIVDPGPDGQLGTADDRIVQLSAFTREIQVTDAAPNLRMIRVIMTYRAAQLQRQYALTTFISSFN